MAERTSNSSITGVFVVAFIYNPPDPLNELSILVSLELTSFVEISMEEVCALFAEH